MSTSSLRIGLQKGFTIVELLVVIVVIAILATVTIIAYNGVVKRANDAALQSELSTAARKIQAYNAANGGYPASTAEADVSAPAGVDARYSKSTATFCLVYSKGERVYSVTQDGKIVTGVCQAGAVSTIAGAAGGGYQDGTGTAARFSSFVALAAAPDGTVYIADRYNHRIRKVSPAGVVSTIAGSGVKGFLDGQGTAAQFDTPEGIAVDGSGIVYVADSGNHRIRKITQSGTVSTFVGSNASTHLDGNAATAQFVFPRSLVIDGSGNMYVGDYYRIRKITPSGTVSTLAGNGTAGSANGSGTAARFEADFGLTIKSDGTLYVADGYNNRIRMVTPAGNVSTYAGSSFGYADGTTSAALFSAPFGITADSAGTLYVSDTSGARIRKITTAGVVSTVAGSGAQGQVDGDAMTAQFNLPTGVSVGQDGTLYIADTNSTLLRALK